MEEIFLQNFKNTLEIEDKEIELTDNFREYEEWDSLNQLSLIAMLDEEYGIQIETDDFSKLTTVGDLLDEVKKRLQ